MELQKNSREWCSFCRQFSRKASTRQETSWSYYLGLADVRILILLDQRKFFSSFSTKHFLPCNENDYNFCYRIKRRIKKVYEYSLKKRTIVSSNHEDHQILTQPPESHYIINWDNLLLLPWMSSLENNENGMEELK